MIRTLLATLFLLVSVNAFGVETLPCPTRSNPDVPNDPPCQSGFPSALIELGNDRVSYSSPTIVDLNGDGAPEIVFGHVAIVMDAEKFLGLITRIDLLNYLRRRVQ